MQDFELRFRAGRGLPWQPLLSLTWALAIGITFLPQAKASFIGDYALSNFTLTSTYKRVAITNSNISTVTASGSIDPLHGERIAQTYADFMWGNAAQPAPKGGAARTVFLFKWKRSCLTGRSSN